MENYLKKVEEIVKKCLTMHALRAIIIDRKGVIPMRVTPKKKRRRRKPTALVERITDLLLDILSAIISGLILTKLIEWLGW